MTPGLRFGRYEVGERIGKGGFGVVHQGRDVELGRDVAIKFLKPEYLTRESIVQRFLQEARAAAKIGHPGIVTVFECGIVHDTGQRLDGTAYIVMELLQGTSLSARTGKPFPIASVAAIGRQLATGLAAAHAAGIVHRDLKPDNVFLVPDAAVVGGERAKILDFGIAKLADPGPGGVHTHSQMMLGTPRYMSPEQARSAAKADARSDIYSLGCILYELVCGRTPFDGRDTGDIIVAHQTEAVTPPSELVDGVPEPLEHLIVSMLAKKPEHRPATMQQIDDAIATLAPTPQGPIVAAPVPKKLVAKPRVEESSLIEPPPGPPPEPRADGDELAIPRPRVEAREAAGMIQRGTIEGSTLTEQTLDTRRGISRGTLGMIGGSILVVAMILFLVCNRSSTPSSPIDATVATPAVDAPPRTIPDAAPDDRGQALRDLRALEAALAARDVKTAARLLAGIAPKSRYAQAALDAYNQGVAKLLDDVVAELDGLADDGNCAELSTSLQALEDSYGRAFAEDARHRVKPCGEDHCPDEQQLAAIKARADALFAEGNYKATLAELERAVGCPGGRSLASKAYLAACRAKDFQAAKRYFTQSGAPNSLAQICMKEGYDPRSKEPPP